ncbi:Segregation and condensation protein A [Gammaproteobacteria bacterium]
MNTEEQLISKEEIILHAVRKVLTQVIRDTAVEPGMLHPLSSVTRDQIRNCFLQITERERELAVLAGRPTTARPRFKDEAHPVLETTIPITAIQRQE